MSRARRNLLPVLAGVAALAVLTALAFSWREIAIQYHLRKLRSDPEYVREVIEEPEETVVPDALHRATKTRDGAETFFRALVLEALGLGREPVSTADRGVDKRARRHKMGLLVVGGSCLDRKEKACSLCAHFPERSWCRWPS